MAYQCHHQHHNKITRVVVLRQDIAIVTTTAAVIPSRQHVKAAAEVAVDEVDVVDHALKILIIIVIVAANSVVLVLVHHHAKVELKKMRVVFLSAKKNSQVCP